MDQFQFFHLCNHQFHISSTDPNVYTIDVQNSGDLIDVLIERARITEIVNIVVDPTSAVAPPNEFDFDNTDDQNYEDVDVQDGYFDDDVSMNVDYRPYVTTPVPPTYYGLYLHNRIKWNVKPPSSYQVTAKVLFTSLETQTYNRADCPRCQGNSWYVDLFNPQRFFAQATGIDYVAQRVVKDLFTELGGNPFDTLYGTTLSRQVFQMGLNDEGLFNHIRSVISTIQDQYLRRQAPLLSSLDPSQRLVNLTVNQIKRSTSNNLGIMIDILVRTVTETRSLRIPLFGGGS